jgi:hypothetical protein
MGRRSDLGERDVRCRHRRRARQIEGRAKGLANRLTLWPNVGVIWKAKNAAGELSVAGFIVDSYRHDPELMKVIIVEVTRAANSFGRTHLPKIGEAYGLIADIVRKAQVDGEFRDTVSPQFAAMAFYGAIEQVLTEDLISTTFGMSLRLWHEAGRWAARRRVRHRTVP